MIQKWDSAELPKLDVLFASLPTGVSSEALERVPKSVKIVDIGGDHRYVDGFHAARFAAAVQEYCADPSRFEPSLAPKVPSVTGPLTADV